MLIYTVSLPRSQSEPCSTSSFLAIRTRCQTEVTPTADHRFSTKLLMKRENKIKTQKTIKKQSFKIKNNKNTKVKKRSGGGGRKSTTAFTEKKDIIFSFCFFFLFLYKCFSSSPSRLLVRLQDARWGGEAAVPQPEQRGQQRGQARRPPGDGRVPQDGVGRPGGVDLRVLGGRRHRRDTMWLDVWFAEVRGQRHLENFALLILPRWLVCLVVCGFVTLTVLFPLLVETRGNKTKFIL